MCVDEFIVVLASFVNGMAGLEEPKRQVPTGCCVTFFCVGEVGMGHYVDSSLSSSSSGLHRRLQHRQHPKQPAKALGLM